MSRAREKGSTDDYRRLSIISLKRDGCLTHGHRFDWTWSRQGQKVASIQIVVEDRHTLRLHYQSRRHGSEAVQHNYAVAVEWTPCHFGGERPWFCCPDCNRRVLYLYGGARFICRHCMRLNYPSQQTSKRNRPFDRAWQLRRQLGCDAGPIDYPAEYIERPKGMHRQTFAKRIEKLTGSEAQAMTVFDEAMERLRPDDYKGQQ